MKLTLNIFAAAVMTIIGASHLGAQSGIGRRFGAHDPRTCGSLKEPSRGAPSAGQAVQYFTCANEAYSKTFGTGEILNLVSGVTIEVGKGRPFNIVTDSFQNIDPTQTVYPIRGSYVSYACSPIGYLGIAAGKNCLRGEGKNLGGILYKDAFGDWHSVMCCILGSTMMPGNAPPSSN